MPHGNLRNQIPERNTEIVDPGGLQTKMTPKAQTGSDKQDHDVHTCLQNSVDLYEILNIGAGTQEGVPSRFTSCEPVFVGPGPTHNCLDPLLQSQENVTIQKDPL